MSSATRKPNRLINESSPYLLQHAHNPVDWHPWREEAFTLAAEKNKPVLVSIGYSSCHWCHVMEHESFENEQVAAFMNEHFINIKVDREERPDVDQIYMEALQAMTGSGGWPLNIFLTPDKKPFYGGTYFPPQDHANRPSWMSVLHSISNAFTQQGDKIKEQAELLTEHLGKTNTLNKDAVLDDTAKIKDDDFNHSFNVMEKYFDEVNGGFGNAPKFPSSFSLNYLMAWSYYYDNDKARQHVFHTLEEMLKGGIYDQLSGGLCRYSTDEKWHVPHFEKMLYDNALFLNTLCQAWKLNPKEHYLDAIKQTAGFIINDMMSPEYLFYSALDADSEGIEGKYYCWTKKEIEAILGKDTDFFCEYFNVTEEGNWEETNILFLSCFPAEFAKRKNITKEECNNKLKQLSGKVLEQRATRIRPGLDDKALLSWNCLMNMALTEVYYVTGDDRFKNVAVKNFDAIRKAFIGKTTNSLLHNYKNNKAFNNAMLDDMALYIEMLLKNLQLTGNLELIKEAIDKTKFTIGHFYSDEEKFFFYGNKNQADLIIRKIDYYDSVTPSGNSVMFSNLHYLYLLTGNNDYRNMAEEMMKRIFSIAATYPTSFSNWLQSFLAWHKPVNEITVTAPVIDKEVQLSLHRKFIPGSFILPLTKEDNNYVYTEGKTVTKAEQYYLCRNFSCFPPLNSLDELFGNIVK